MRDFLEDLKVTDPDDFAAVIAGSAKLRNRQYHREPLSKALGDGLFEMRHVGKLNTRIIGFFMKNRRIVALHGICNKGQGFQLVISILQGNGCATGGEERNHEKNQFRPLS